MGAFLYIFCEMFEFVCQCNFVTAKTPILVARAVMMMPLMFAARLLQEALLQTKNEHSSTTELRWRGG